ncbi:hypothetical protein GCM10010508_33620 [Streptomyces naganishii JCM 4654]|uniref:Uncharacterized protein n=1 Tax=Streptomyces naganishii JCM 4654 TaxID=1306179 RepID=A0A919CW49_9ACTN|nr:hypothetical protein GCM10010508_33620 [Streptomyces naganishii JCM 4654]
MFTGKTLVDGEWVFRKDCISRAGTLGAACQDSFSKRVTLVVHGELAGNVKDTDRGLSRKLLKVIESRRAGQHIHVVDAAGFSDLLFGAPARCRDLKMQGDQVTVLPEVGDGILGGPFDRLGLRNRRISQLEAHIFGRGTPRHERLLTSLVNQVAGRTHLEVRGPARRAPQFDLGWVDGPTAYGAWVASPESPNGEGLDPLEEAARQIGRSLRSIRSQTQLRPLMALDNSVDISSRLRQTAKSAGVHVSRIKDLPG